MGKQIQYVKGDATKPTGTGTKIIVHVCNDIGAWGKGFVLALSARWPLPEKAYREWFAKSDNFTLGQVQFVQVEKDIYVANLIGQRDIVPDANGQPPIRYKAVEEGLEKIALTAAKKNASIHMPRIGCGLAGGQWRLIEPLIKQKLINKNISVIVYDFS